jgi:hypothetical protein
LTFGAYGGHVGQDSVKSNFNGHDAHTYREGERLVVFLSGSSLGAGTMDGSPLWQQEATFIVTPEGLAADDHHFLAIPLQRLLDEIAAAQQGP